MLGVAESVVLIDRSALKNTVGNLLLKLSIFSTDDGEGAGERENARKTRR